MQSLLRELYVKLPSPPAIYCDNIGATYVCANPVFHSRMKHIAIDYRLVRDQVSKGFLHVSHISTKDQLADALTKPLSSQRFDYLRSKIGVLDGISIFGGVIRMKMIMVKQMVPRMESNPYSLHDYRQHIPMIMVSTIIHHYPRIELVYSQNFLVLNYSTHVYIMMTNHLNKVEASFSLFLSSFTDLLWSL